MRLTNANRGLEQTSFRIHRNRFIFVRRQQYQYSRTEHHQTSAACWLTTHVACCFRLKFVACLTCFTVYQMVRLWRNEWKSLPVGRRSSPLCVDNWYTFYLGAKRIDFHGSSKRGPKLRWKNCYTWNKHPPSILVDDWRVCLRRLQLGFDVYKSRALASQDGWWHGRQHVNT